MRPTFNFLGVWLAIDLLMRAGGLGSLSPLRHVAIGNTIPKRRSSQRPPELRTLANTCP